MFKFELREKDDVVIADLFGRLTLGDDGTKALHVLVDELLGSGRRNLVLNLAGMEYLDSSGLGELVGAFRTTQGMGGKMKVLSPRGRVYNTLSLARLLPLFEVFESEHECIASFRNHHAEPEREVLLAVRDHVALITLHRPKSLNALTRRMLSELVSALEAARAERKVRAIVLTGSGRAFCYGADAEELREGTGALPTLEMFQSVIREIASVPRPVIAAVNGFATGAGFDLALACDLRVLSEKAKLASAFLRFGLVPDGGSTHILPQLVGMARAAELVFTGRAIDAEEALRLGLANRVVPAAEVVDSAIDWAAELARGPYRAMGRAKRLLRTGPGLDLTAALQAEALEQRAQFEDAEFHEGLTAHLEKREPSFPE